MPQTLYPRGTLKKIVKAHANRPLSKNVDILVRAPQTQHAASLLPLKSLIPNLLSSMLVEPIRPHQRRSLQPLLIAQG